MAGAKESPVARKPMTMGVVIADRLPMKLKVPPVSPSNRAGARVETSDQVIDASPLPKNASARKAMTSGVNSTKLAPMIDVEISSPPMIGSLRAKPTLLPRRINQSEKNPEHSTPTNAARNGNEASRPDLMKSMPRYLTR